MASRWDQPQETLSANRLARQDTTSSVESSDLYKPLPSGRWLLEFHASCPKCHHYHSGAKLKIDNHDDKSKASPVLCENCKDPWMLFGGRNSTQLSLLSVMSTVPDPVEREVHRLLVAMVRPVTAVATSHLARNPGTTADDVAPEGSSALGSHETTSLPPNTNRDIFQGLSVSKQQKRTTLRPKIITRSVSGLNSADTGQHPFFNFRKKLVTRFPILSRVASIAADRPLTSTRRVNDRAQDTQHISMNRCPVSNRNSATTEHVSSIGSRPGTVDAATPPLSPEAQKFMTEIKDNPISSMNQEDRIRWARKKLTAFRLRRASAALLEEPSFIDRVSLASSDDLLHMPVSQLDRPGSIGHLLGSHSGHFDGLYFTDSIPPTHRDSMSERTSEVTTAAGDGLFGPRIPFQGLLSHERQSSGSSRRFSVQSAPRTWQQIQNIRTEARYSQDISSAAAIRDVPGARARIIHRLSGGAALRTSNEDPGL